MGVFDKILSFLRLNDDYEDEYDDDFFDDEEDVKGFAEEEEEEPQPRRHSFRDKKKSKYDDFDINEGGTSSVTGSKVTHMRHPSSKRSVSGMEVYVVKPTSVDTCREITEALLAGRTVVLNLEGLEVETAQRIIDFVSGATFAISGNLTGISNYIYLVTPTNVDISGDLQDLLSGSMDQQNMRGRF